MNPQPDTCIHRILVADDNPAIHEDFRKILCPAETPADADLASMVEEVFGETRPKPAEGRFEMDSAYQGREALAKVEQAEADGRPYSLVFMDVRMPPGWDGVETIKHIWQHHPDIQVVICTAYSDYSWEEILQSLGETDSLIILKKPFDNVEVLQLAHTLTKKWLVTRKANTRMADLDEAVRQRTQELLAANQQLQSEIQQRVEIEAALRESEDRFHQAFEAVALPLSICALESGGHLEVNLGFVALCGYAEAEVLGKTVQDLRLLVEPDQYTQLVQKVTRGEPVRGVPLALRRRDGAIRETLASLEILKLRAQRCLLAAFQDVTEQKSLEAQLRHSQKLEAVGGLAAGVAHDFNNLLTIIHGYASLQLARATLDTQIVHAFTQIKMASERAAALTRQLLTFSRHQLVKRETLHLDAALRRMHGLLARMLGETITVECHLPPDLPCVYADENNLDQVVMNLAVNARDAMPKGGKLSFSAEVVTLTPGQVAGHPERRAGSFVVLAVADTGCGMDERTLSRIFEPFFTTKPVGRGTGLGLSTVYGILKQHDGWIEVASQLGHGTTFRAFLPVSRQGEKPAPAVAPTVPRPRWDAKAAETILVVEDEPAVQEFILSVLKTEGYEVLCANSGAEALEQWKTIGSRVRLLLTDLVMPDGVSGTMLGEELLRQRPDLPIVYTSGYSPDAMAGGKLLQEGLNFLPKPFAKDQLVTTVRQALRAPVQPPMQAMLQTTPP